MIALEEAEQHDHVVRTADDQSNSQIRREYSRSFTARRQKYKTRIECEFVSTFE